MRLAGAGHRDVFEYGWSAFVEALEAEAQLRKAEADLSAASYQRHLALLRLNFLAGKL